MKTFFFLNIIYIQNKTVASLLFLKQTKCQLVVLITEMFAFRRESVNSSSIKKCTQAAEFNINVDWKEKNRFSIIYQRRCISKLAVATAFAVELVSQNVLRD